MPEGMRKMFVALRTQAERAGVQMPELEADGNVKLPPPAVSLHGRPAVITRQIAEIAAGAGLYLMNDDLVLIAPRTGVPARGARLAAVVCPSARLADAWSTALLVRDERPAGMAREMVSILHTREGEWRVEGDRAEEVVQGRG